MLNKFNFNPPQSSRPGVQLKEVDFHQYGEKRVPFDGGQFTIEPGAESKPDTHQVSECWMIVQGEGVLNYDGQEYKVCKGDFLFFEPQKTHFLRNEGEETVIVYTVWWLEQ